MRERTAVSCLVALTAALAAPYALAGTNFILDDWFALRNAMFDGALAAGGHNQALARPGAWLIYGFTFGLIGNHPLPMYLLQTAVNAAVAVALFGALRRFLPIGPSFAAAAIWVVIPNHTSLDNWASAINISVALLAVLIGIAAIGRSRANWVAAACFVVSALCYEATMPLAAVACVAVPLFEGRRPRLREDLALPAAALAGCGAWIVTHWHPDKHVGGWADLGQFLPAHFGWGVVWGRPYSTLLVTVVTVVLAVVLARRLFPSWRTPVEQPEAMVLVGLAVMALGVLPFLRYFYAPVGAGDRVSVVSSVGGALVWTGLGWMALKLSRPGTIVLAAAVALGALTTNVHRDRLYARAGDDVLRTMTALDRAFPDPAGPIALGPHPLFTENIGGLLDESNVDGALQVHRHRDGVRGYVSENKAAWLRAPAELRFDQVRLLYPRRRSAVSTATSTREVMPATSTGTRPAT
jgi:hypothetical protein